MSEDVRPIRVAKWLDYQHYKQRDPPWVKLHRKLLANPDWFALPDSAARLLPELWLIASERGGALPASRVLAFRLHRTDAQIIAGLNSLVANGFLEDASGVLAPRLQDASPEERRGETEQREETTTSDESDDAFEEVWAACPRGSKKLARGQYRKAVPSKVEHAVLLAEWEGAVKSAREIQYVPHLYRWIRDERWQEVNGNGHRPTSGFHNPTPRPETYLP